MAVIRFGSRFMFSEKACRRQIRWMPKLLPAKMQYPEEIQAYYIQDMPRVRMESLENMYRTYMAKYRLKESVRAVSYTHLLAQHLYPGLQLQSVGAGGLYPAAFRSLDCLLYTSRCV